MAYKYEKTIKEELEFISLEFIGNQDEMLKELQEVYRKAKSFDEIVKAVNAPYVEYPEDWMVDVLKVVRNFEQGSAEDER